MDRFRLLHAVRHGRQAQVYSDSRPEDSGAVFYLSKHTSFDVWACLGVNNLDMLRTLIRRVKENTLNNQPCPIIPTLTSSSVVHHSFQLLCFFHITMPLK